MPRGVAFYGKVPEKKGRFRKAKIIVIPLADNIWAHDSDAAGHGLCEYSKFDAVLGRTLAGELAAAGP